LGRNRSCDIVLPCAKISRIHGTFVWRYIDDTNPFHQLIDGDYFGKMPSTNGIFVNGQHVDKIWERLNHKDLITLGEVKIVYLLLEPLENPTDSSKETYQNMKDAK
jgi:pSer/pThr/pTyr-binding forkhead associated (FHA) protein